MMISAMKTFLLMVWPGYILLLTYYSIIINYSHTYIAMT